ncbi:MAG: DnaA regulatory inactivator Hda [Pseudomonadota bacterium]|nr:DnaA regulatory inactivator Hda [Pseudomonadota bacterium]
MKGAQLPLAVQLRDTASFESYFAGTNGEAVAALRELQQPLLLCGPVGSGRTHLLQSACREFGGAYLPLTDLLPHGPEMLDGYSGVSAVWIDDIDSVCDQADWCIALLRLLDQLRSDGRRVALTANTTPEHLNVARPDLRTRLSQCLVLGLKTLDDQQRAALLRLRAGQRGLTIPDEVLRWLLNTQARDTGSLLEALDTLDRASLTAKRRVTLPLAQAALGSRDGYTNPLP